MTAVSQPPEETDMQTSEFLHSSPMHKMPLCRLTVLATLCPAPRLTTMGPGTLVPCISVEVTERNTATSGDLL